MPAAEIDISADLVRRLLGAQHPDLAHLPISVLANGWDNLICRLGDELLVRLPRRALAARLTEHEQRWLPLLARRLPLPVPAPVRVGRPDAGYPWSWSIVPYLPGRTAADEPADPSAAASAMGGFLAALHEPAPAEAPANQVRGVPLADRVELVTGHLAALSGEVDVATARRVWAAALARPRWGGAPVWVHGDLHPANILVERGRISGILDFGDITSGDPATDLSVGWMLLPADCREEFRDSYRYASPHGLDDDTWARARGWALTLALSFLANSADNPRMAAIGASTLRAVLNEVERPNAHPA